jgi:hypothetical protein
LSDKVRFGEILVRAGVLERERLDQAMAALGEGDGDLGEYLVRRGLVDEAAMLQAISRALNLPTVSLANVQPDERALGLVPRELCVEYTLFPVELESTRGGDHLHVAMANPSDVRAIKQITRKARRRIRPLVAPAREIRQAIAQHYGGGGQVLSTGEAVRAPTTVDSPVDMFDFDVTDLSSSEGGLSSGLGSFQGRVETGSDAVGLAVDFGTGGGGLVDLGESKTESGIRRPVALERLPERPTPRAGMAAVRSLDARSEPVPPQRPDAVRGEPMRSAGEPVRPRPDAPRRPVALFSTPPPAPAAPEDLFEHSTFGEARSQPRARSSDVERPARGEESGLFEHSERNASARTVGDDRGERRREVGREADTTRLPSLPRAHPPPAPRAAPRTPAQGLRTHDAPTSRPPRPGPPVSFDALPGAARPASTPPPRSFTPPPRVEEASDGAGMMIRKRRRGPEGPPALPPRPGPAFPVTPTPPQRMSETPTPAEGIDIRKLFERIDARDENLAAGDAVISRYLERYGTAEKPPSADEFLEILERALGRAGSPTARLLVLLVRRLARHGLLDPEDLVADMTRRQ